MKRFAYEKHRNALKHGKLANTYVNLDRRKGKNKSPRATVIISKNEKPIGTTNNSNNHKRTMHELSVNNLVTDMMFSPSVNAHHILRPSASGIEMSTLVPTFALATPRIGSVEPQAPTGSRSNQNTATAANGNKRTSKYSYNGAGSRRASRTSKATLTATSTIGGARDVEYGSDNDEYFDDVDHHPFGASISEAISFRLHKHKSRDGTVNIYDDQDDDDEDCDGGGGYRGVGNNRKKDHNAEINDDGGGIPFDYILDAIDSKPARDLPDINGLNNNLSLFNNDNVNDSINFDGNGKAKIGLTSSEDLKLMSVNNDSDKNSGNGSGNSSSNSNNSNSGGGSDNGSGGKNKSKKKGDHKIPNFAFDFDFSIYRRQSSGAARDLKIQKEFDKTQKKLQAQAQAQKKKVKWKQQHQEKRKSLKLVPGFQNQNKNQDGDPPH